MKIKRSAIFFLVVFLGTLLFTLSSCQSKNIIGVSLPNQATSLNVGIYEDVKALFEKEGYTVKVQSAEDKSTDQKQQIEAFITMGVKMIVVAPVEMGTIEESLKNARNKGIKVVVSGASDITDGCYDAVTVSNEYLVGTYIALLAKHWVESHFDESSKFSTLIMKSSLAADPISRSNGMAQIKEEWLKNDNGDYIDKSGNVVTEENRVENPAYCALVAKNEIIEVQMGMSDTGKALVQNALTNDPNVRVVLMYGSLFAAGASQYIVDNYTNLDDFGIFGGGVSGNEGAYLLGSLSDGVGETISVGGTNYTGVKSVFRGAVSFGGEDAAMAVAELAYKVFFGEENVDYTPRTPETLGLWLTYEDDLVETLACSDISSTTVLDFEPETIIKDSLTKIKWTKNK